MFTTLSAVSLKRVMGIAVTTVLTLGVMTAVPLSAQAVDAPSIVITQVTETASSDSDPKSVHVPIAISGFDSSPVVAVTLRLTAEDSGTLSIDNTTGLTLTSGFTTFSGESEIGFKASLATATSVLANNVKWHTPQSGGTIPLEVTIGPELPAGVVLNPSNGHLYEYVNTGVNWATALARAKTNTRFGMTGYLLTVTNWTENLFVTSRLTTSNIWLAAGDQSGSWKWYAGPENGSNVGYTRWGFLQPDNWGKFQGCGFLCLEWITEDRASMNYTFATGFWNDKYYNDNANYVIEYGGLAGETSTYTPFTATADLTSVSRFKSFIDYANNNAGTRPSLLDVLLAELDGITNDSTLNAIISALTTPAIDGSAVDSRTELQAIADAFKRILDYANGISSNDGLTAPTASDFSAIGANLSASLNSDKSALVNDVIARRATAEVDEVNELEGLALIVERLFATTSLVNQPTPALSASDFSALGVTGVTSTNIKTARAAVRGKTASQIDSVSELQSLIDPALVAAQALATITNYADANTGTKPTVTDFSNAGVTGVTSSNLKSIQSSLATLLIYNVHIPSSTEITSIVNAFDAILDEAGSGTTDVTGEQFQLVGVANASTYEANVISLVNSIIESGPVSKFDTANELTSYFNIANKVISDPSSLTVYELWALGFTDVTEENLPYVKNAISASTDLSSLALLTDSVDAGVAAGNAWFIINSYAITNTGPKPTLANYQAAGITQATEAGLGLLNSMLASRPIGLGEIDDDGELSNLAWSADEIVHFYDEVNSLPSDHLWPFFAGAGFYISPEVSEEMSNSATSLFISVANQFSDATHFDTFNEVQALLDITQAVTAKTAGLEFYRYPVASDFAAMGMNNIQSGDLTTLNAILESTADDGTEIDTYTELQNIVDTISTTPFDGTDAQAMVDAFAASKFYFWPTAAMWNTVTGNSNTTLENVYLLNSMAYSPIFTNFTTVTVSVDEAAAKIVGYAGESATAPSKDDYAALKVDQVDFLSTDGLNFFNAFVKAMSPSDVTTFEHLNSVAFIVNQLFVSANGMSVYQWHALGYADVTSEIRSDVNSRVAALGTPTFAGIDQAIADAKAAAGSWRAIKTYADTNIGDVPTSADFSTIGVTVPATEGLLDAVIEVLASSSITAEDTDVTASVQSIVDAVAVLFAWADGPTVTPTTFGSPANLLRPATATAPTAADYAALNATTAASLTGNALALLNDIVADQTAAELDIPGDIEALAFIISVLFYDAHSVPASNILALGGTGVHEDNIADVQNRLYSGIQLIYSVETLQEQINAGINAQQLLLDAIALVQSYSDANSGSAPTLSTYVDLGIVLSDSTMITEVNTVWASAGLTSGDVPDLQAIKDVVAAYERVIAGTASASDLGAIGDDTAAGLLVVSEVLPLFNSFNAYLENASTADELSAMAAASHVAITSPDSMTFADFQALSLTSVTEDNFGMIKQAMSLVSASARNSRDEILGLVTSGIASGTAALSDLNDFADGYGSAPSVADYEAAGIDGVTADNLATINSMLLAGIPTAPFTASQLQAAFDAYLLILTYANGATSQDGLTVPTDETFNLATNVDMSYFTPTSLAFLVNRLGQLDKSAINTVPELMALIDAVDHLFRSQNELTLADLIALGFTDVTEDTLAAVKAALQANAGSLTDLASIQSLISTTSAEALGALAIIRAYADNQSVVPSVEDYETAGLSGVNQYNLEDVNAAIAAVTASEVNTTAKIQAIIIDVNADMVLAQVVAYANGGATDAPLAGAYKMVGIGGVAGPSEEWAALISMFVHHNSATSYDTLDELLALADATYALSNNPGNLTVEDFTALGFEGVTADNLLIAATGLVNANLSSVESILAALNAALDVTIPQAPSAAGLTSKSVRVTWAAPTGEAIDAVVTIRNGATTVCVADAIAAKCDVVGLKSKTSYTLSVEYSNMGYTKTHSVTASTLKTPGPYKTSKILFNAYSTKISSVGTKALWDALRNVRKHNASMIEITGAVQKTGYTGNDAKLALKRAEKIKTWFRERGVTIKIVVKRSKPVALSDIAGRQATVKLFD